MKISATFLLFGICAAGLLSGVAARRIATGRDAHPASILKAAGQNNLSPVVAGDKRLAAKTSNFHSTDTLETLAALDKDSNFARLAHWLIDASEQDIATYWAAYQKGKRRNNITDLIFINWTRLNPQGAIATGEPRAWWAWACHDMQAALTAAGSDRVNDVARGIGEFHPAWLRAHFTEIPEAAREEALVGLARWGDAENPLEMLKFAKERRRNFDNSTFKALVSKDPWAAWDWVKENPSKLDALVARMAEERPDDLARLAAQSPSGETKRTMEAALFANLIKTDTEAAIAQAKATDVPRVAAERLAAVGLALVKTNPDQAFEMAARLLAACPDAMMQSNPIQLPGGQSSGSLTSAEGVSELMDSLLMKDPAKLMDIAIVGSPDDPRDNYPLEQFSDEWVRSDMAAYSDWVKRQADPAIRNHATDKVIRKFQQDGKYRDAADWAMSLIGPNRIGIVMNVAIDWARNDRANALEWLETADLPAEDKSTLRNDIAQ